MYEASQSFAGNRDEGVQFATPSACGFANFGLTNVLDCSAGFEGGQAP